ncbi:MAG: RNA 2',3'-cyclic phosphodiesterase [Steroidobacteraceae bacterium]
MRLFFALWPDVDVARQLTQLARRLNLQTRSRWIDPKNYHVTLAFLGEVSAADLAVLQQIGRSLRAGQFTVRFDSIEFWRESRVVVAAARAAPPGLLDLWRKLNEAIGLPREPLRAHVTLARKVTQAPVPQAMSPVVWPVTNFRLIRSDSGAVESAYTVLDTWSLLDEIRNP